MSLARPPLNDYVGAPPISPPSLRVMTMVAECFAASDRLLPVILTADDA